MIYYDKDFKRVSIDGKVVYKVEESIFARLSFNDEGVDKYSEPSDSNERVFLIDDFTNGKRHMIVISDYSEENLDRLVRNEIEKST